MFYSETLLGRTGALARVWLSANLERKLSKSQILQSDIESSVNAMVNQGQAPLALRLSAQLLLGVVRIYSRKARYLLDDCNEALIKLKLAFRPTNNDDMMAVLNVPAGSITLPNLLTEDDLFANLELDPSLLLGSQGPSKGIDFGDLHESSTMDWASSPLGESSHREVMEDRPQLEEDYGMELDLGLDDPIGGSTSIEIGMDAPAPRPDDPFSDDNKLQDGEGMELDLGLDDEPALDHPNGIAEPHDNLDNFLGGDDGFNLGGDEFDLPNINETNPLSDPDRARRSQSRLSSVRSSVLRDHEETHDGNDEVAVRQAQRAKKRKLVQPDADTVLHNRQIKDQQQDRSKILKPTSFLPRDPFLLTLMNMQKNGDFVSRVMGGGMAGLAPELRGILSIDIVRRSGELKRKRDSGIADMDEEAAENSPRLEYDEEDQLPPMDEGLGLGGDSFHNSTMIDLPAANIARPTTRDSNGQYSEEDGIADNNYDNFDDTTAPLVHPADNGPVSLGTKHAVHLLRERFGPSAGESPSSQKRASVLFQELLPEQRTSKTDATKMFFEVLVLATKDAVKVEQHGSDLGDPIRIRGKRGLWGSWAETEAGGEIAAQGTQLIA